MSPIKEESGDMKRKASVRFDIDADKCDQDNDSAS